MYAWTEAWLQQFIVATTRRNWFCCETSCNQKPQGAKHLLRRNDQGRNILGVKHPGGKRRLAEEMGNGLGQISYMYLGATQKCSCLFTWSRVLCPISNLTFHISGRMVRAHDSGAEGWPVQSRWKGNNHEPIQSNSFLAQDIKGKQSTQREGTASSTN